MEEASSSIISLKNVRPPDDTVFYCIYPDFSGDLQSLRFRIVDHLRPLIAPYIWQHHQPFETLLANVSSPISYLSGHLRFGDNLEDEWFLVYLLFNVSEAFPDVSIRVWDSDGEFLLIESAFHLPKWLNPETSTNRVFVRRGLLHIIPRSRFPETPKLEDSLRFLASSSSDSESRGPDAVQLHLNHKISQYPQRAYKNVHRSRVRVPVSVAWLLRQEPSLISLAVEGFYDRDIDSMKYAARMEKFLPKGKEEETVELTVSMSRAMYAQLVQQKFQAPGCYPMPERSNLAKFVEAELGMKITCGFEMMYQLKKKQTEEGKGSAWEVYRESLEKSGQFDGLLPGSKEYKRLLKTAEENYQNSLLSVRASELLNAPVKCIDNLLALPHSVEDFIGQDLPQSDDDSWLYGGEDELNACLNERQKEMELYDLKLSKKDKSKEVQGQFAGTSAEEYDLNDITKSMQAFVTKISSYEGAEVPEDRNLKDVDFDADQFMKHINAVIGLRGSDDKLSDLDLDEEFASDLDFDDFENDSEDSEDIEDTGNTFSHSYSDALNEELKGTTLNKTFINVKEQTSSQRQEDLNEENEDFDPVDVDFNLVKNLLDSFSSQQGLPGPASNLLGMMGVKLPDDAAGK